jgi:hypothetical protein
VTHGNLFDSFLRGHTPAQSWDTRKEVEVLGGAKPVAPRLVRDLGASSPPGEVSSPRADLMNLVRHRYSASFVAKLNERLAPGAAHSGKKGAFKEFNRLVATMSDEQVASLLAVVRGGAEASTSTPSRTRVVVVDKHLSRKKRKQIRQTTAERLADSSKAKAEAARQRQEAKPGKCSRCGRTLSREERRLADTNAETLAGQLYCLEHASRLLRGAAPPAPVAHPACVPTRARRRTAPPDTVVVAAGAAYDFYRRHSAYVCQEGRGFKDVAYVGFYRDRRIEKLVPQIVAWRDHVPFTRENANRLLESAREHDYDVGTVIWNALREGSRFEGDRHLVILLTPPEDPRTKRLESPVRHYAETAWTLGQRYAWLDELTHSRTTDELERRRR